MSCSTPKACCPILHLGLPDSYQHHASREDLLAEAGIDAAGIRAAVLKRWPQLAAGTRRSARPAECHSVDPRMAWICEQRRRPTPDAK